MMVRPAPGGGKVTEPLYRRILGERFTELPHPLQAMHDVPGVLSAQGRARVERGGGVVIALIGWIFRFPAAGDDVPLTVTFSTVGAQELWQRNFAGQLFCSSQEAGTGRYDGLLVERFGPLSFAMTVLIRNHRLHLELVGASALGVPLPRFLLPSIDVFEHDADGRFNFHVDLGLPLIGRMVRYTGWLAPISSSEAENEAL